MLCAECPNIEEEAKSPQQDDHAVAALIKKAMSAEAACIEYTCVYVAFQIYNSDAIRKDGKAGADMRTGLGKALATRATCLHQQIFQDEMLRMNEFLAEKKRGGQAATPAATTA